MYVFLTYTICSVNINTQQLADLIVPFSSPFG
jgi:hypothetical protein